MRFTRYTITILVSVSFLTCLASRAATTISSVGSQTNLPGWRDDTVAKTQDSDGDDIYGTVGYALFAAAPGFAGGGFFTMSSALVSLPSYVTISPIAVDYMFRHGSYADINDPTNVNGPLIDSGSAFINAGAFAGNAYDLFSISFGPGAPDFLRIGILMDNLEIALSPSALRLYQSGGGDSGTIAKTQINNAANFYFFDVVASGASLSGETIILAATKGTAPGNSQIGISGFTFDAAPEPSRSLLALLGACAIGLRRRRRLV